jgi:hypothetical protein
VEKGKRGREVAVKIMGWERGGGGEKGKRGKEGDEVMGL